MTRVAALALALLAATPAVADVSPPCLRADDAVRELRAALPRKAHVIRLGGRLSGVVRAWLEDRAIAGYAAEDYLEVGGDRGVAVFPIRDGTVCYGAGVVVGGDALRELLGMFGRYREITGIVDGEA